MVSLTVCYCGRPNATNLGHMGDIQLAEIDCQILISTYKACFYEINFDKLIFSTRAAIFH